MIDLTPFPIILVNTSAGKDSQVMADLVTKWAREQGVADRILAVHCDLGQAEWAGVGELAQTQSDLMGIPLEIVKRPQGDLVEQIRARGMFPGSKERFCTSDQKRGQVLKVMTRLVKESGWKKGDAPVRILNCMGLRIDESGPRGKRLRAIFAAEGAYLETNKKATNSKRLVQDFYPIAELTEADVWAHINAGDIPHHYAYDLGMPRLSCAFCIFANRDALLVSGRANPELLQTYVELEKEIDHKFTNKLSISEIADAIERGEEADMEKLKLWSEAA